jgi:hypothetical protein
MTHHIVRTHRAAAPMGLVGAVAGPRDPRTG